ncbi:MAG: phosphatidylserine decarboxylase family protein [Gemmatimonadetes bacterium]|nr:phosphatidylserine decarboxylase family protein [Gemmatimonadota bacterium]
MISIAREGMPFVAGAGALALTAWGAAGLREGGVIWVVAALASFLALAFAFFFRDPDPEGPRDPRLLLAPAYGRIVQVAEVEEPTFLGGRATRISIFLSLFDVHVQRSPAGGVVAHRVYEPGGFRAAWAHAASDSNEQSSLGIETDAGRVLVRQIAGLIARRISTYPEQGERVEQGQRIGLIRFGSRVDTFVPAGWRVRVAIGDRARAAVTVLAERAGSGP